ncbi:TOX high mobility group box family member 4 [Oryzias melastigma]|uniref:TOX high mobility group box family member 4 n=1 Tax=Oryzias melastigma TaxID=30732 RepID=A0A834BWA4_ORYME|nr:TOX high mobility group box family member 4 [Oryzias melastigma]
MELNFYSDLSDGCAQNVEFLDSQPYGGFSEDNKFTEAGDRYLSMSGESHSFLSAEQTFHTPSLGDEVFEIPPISLDPDQALSISDAHFELSDGAGVSSGSKSLVSNLVAEANDPSFASTFINSGSHGLEHMNLGAVHQGGGTALLSSSALELGNSTGSHFSSSSPMTIDVQLADIGPGLLGSSQLATINPSELALGLCGDNIGRHPEMPEQPLSATPSPAGSLQDEDMNDFRRSVLVEAPMSLSSSPLLSHMPFHPTPLSSAQPAAARRGLGMPAAATEAPKKGRKKKDPNEPQKPVSAYALFFRDTQAAIKGQNPNASFGEVSKIVASMWDSLAEDQKQVYKRKTEAAKKEYLKALAAYKANQLSQPSSEEMESAPSPPPSSHPTPPPPGNYSLHPALASTSVDVNTLASVCSSNIILDVPEVTMAGAGPTAPAAPTITKIIIPKHILQGGGQVLTVLPGGVRSLQPTLVVAGATRQPPPLQQMLTAPPPPRLQQMAPAPPPLQAKPREGGPASAQPASITATPPPPLQIKIVPATIQDKGDVLLHAVSASARSEEAANFAETAGNTDDDVTEVLHSEEEEMEVSGYDDVKSLCVRAGCNNPAVDSEDWDREYCSNECVATHCRDVFQAWCSIKNQSVATVK